MKTLKWISIACFVAVLCNVGLAYNANQSGISSEAQIKGIVGMTFIGVPAFVLFLIGKMLGFGKKKRKPE